MKIGKREIELKEWIATTSSQVWENDNVIKSPAFLGWFVEYASAGWGDKRDYWLGRYFGMFKEV